MISFSERQGIVPERAIQTDSVDDHLRNRLWNYFFNEEFVEKHDPIGVDWASSNYGMVEDMLDLFGCRYEDPDSGPGHVHNQQTLQKLLSTCDWNYVYEFIENYLSLLSTEEGSRVACELNALLEEEKSGYRIIKEKECGKAYFIVSPITDNEELATIEKSLDCGLASVNISMKKALALYSDRQTPDYANSIKESISAVESMLAHIIGKEATLSGNLKELDKLGLDLHPAFKDALGKLYGFTSDSSGIRHGGYSEPLQGTEQNARFMLIVCSAFINYLKQVSQVDSSRGGA